MKSNKKSNKSTEKDEIAGLRDFLKNGMERDSELVERLVGLPVCQKQRVYLMNSKPQIAEIIWSGGVYEVSNYSTVSYVVGRSPDNRPEQSEIILARHVVKEKSESGGYIWIAYTNPNSLKIPVPSITEYTVR